MRKRGKLSSVLLSAILILTSNIGTAQTGDSENALREPVGGDGGWQLQSVQLGPRPFWLVDNLNEGELKETLKNCANGPFAPSEFSIAHRGAPLQFPEHTLESYVAAARMGAGVIECDVSFTSDRELVCRHSQCDLHQTTDILAHHDLAASCSTPFQPATLDANGEVVTPARASCCTSDISLAEFKTLKGKMDASDSGATSVEAYLGGTPAFRTDLYAKHGTLLTHTESIELFASLGVKMAPELKAPSVEMPHDGDYTQEDYAQQLLDEYEAAGIAAEDVLLQSFNLADVEYWIANAPEFGAQAIYLDSRYENASFEYRNPDTWLPDMTDLVDRGVRKIAPPLWMLLQLDDNGAIVPSPYAIAAREAGLDIITWTLERSGSLGSGGGWYYQSVTDAIDADSDVLTVLDVLARDVGVIGVFSDWPATTTYYANCMGL